MRVYKVQFFRHSRLVPVSGLYRPAVFVVLGALFAALARRVGGNPPTAAPVRVARKGVCVFFARPAASFAPHPV